MFLEGVWMVLKIRIGNENPKKHEQSKYRNENNMKFQLIERYHLLFEKKV